MGHKSLPTPVVAAIIAVVVIVVGIFLYRGVTGGTVGEGQPGSVQASPPMPAAARQQMLQNASKP